MDCLIQKEASVFLSVGGFGCFFFGVRKCLFHKYPIQLPQCIFNFLKRVFLFPCVQHHKGKMFTFCFDLLVQPGFVHPPGLFYPPFQAVPHHGRLKLPFRHAHTKLNQGQWCSLLTRRAHGLFHLQPNEAQRKCTMRLPFFEKCPNDLIAFQALRSRHAPTGWRSVRLSPAHGSRARCRARP